jgi:hypothetical protein
MEQELLILPEHPWLIVEFVNTTRDAPEVLIVPAPLVLPFMFTNSIINQGCSGRINSSCSISVTRRVHELYYKPGMLRKD